MSEVTPRLSLCVTGLERGFDEAIAHNLHRSVLAPLSALVLGFISVQIPFRSFCFLLLLLLLSSFCFFLLWRLISREEPHTRER